MTQRRAIDSSGKLGSFYDIRQDLVLEGPAITDNGGILHCQTSTRCDIIDGNTDKSQNLLKMIGTDDGLRLNILLNPRLRRGIAALADHSSPIDKYTRFLYFFHTNQEQRLPDDSSEARKLIKLIAPTADSTHVITAVTFGIDIVVVMQLPRKDNTANEIDIILEKIRKQLDKSKNYCSYTTTDEISLEKITEIKAYSNVSKLTKSTSLLEICQYIDGYKKQPNIYHPLKYTLRPIEWLYSDGKKLSSSYATLEKDVSDNLEQYLIQLSITIKKLKHSLKYDLTTSLFQNLPEQVDAVQIQYQSIQKGYEDELERLRNLILDINGGEKKCSDIDKAAHEVEESAVKDSILDMRRVLNGLKEKGQVIANLKREHIEYCNVAQHNGDKNHTEQSLKDKLRKDDRYDIILCSSDSLKKKDQSKWEHSCCQLGDEYRNCSSLRLLYADFTYCSFELSDNDILTKNEKSKEKELAEQIIPTPTTPLPSSNGNDINILLLGESGVGKSTFINAFVNYLKFKTFEQAETGKPVVLIPVSFLITTGHNFEEHTVQFGEPDSFNNEDFDHPGQSVTQHCKSYIFHLNHNNGKKLLRIIDTPGFGDTRGVDQDDANMQHILEYINNLTHFNAICFLLKPNASQINNFFQIYLTQLLDLLGPDARQNIIFCFTNARSTFYAPGDTAPLLKDILKSLPIGKISFNKENTFCFDNESFRYMVSLQNSIAFDDQDKKEYEMSWSTSVKESRRLCEYICDSLSACYIRDKQQSVTYAQLQITHMIRPMLEAMRNILRNIILWEMDTPDKSIYLLAERLCYPAAICSACKYKLMSQGKFWIVRNEPHKIQGKCSSCNCAPNQHITINYKLEYEYSEGSSDHNLNEMKKQRDLLKNASIHFAHFLMHVARSSKDDPFWIGIAQMIREENYLCKNQESNALNMKLVKHLKQLKTEYEQRIDEMQPNREYSKLPVIYDWIQNVRKDPMVQVQMKAVRETQKKIMKLYEFEVSEHVMNA